VGEVTIAISLVVYALVRMDALGVNVTGIFATTALVSGAIAFSLQATLNNLWGGISLQLDNTCRIGDWIEIEGVTGEVVSIRWRYTAIATVTNVTIIIPNAQLMNNRVTLLGRRGDQRIPSGRRGRSSASLARRSSALTCHSWPRTPRRTASAPASKRARSSTRSTTG
jgi:small-conductance mechanosensitive channel